MYDLRIYTKGGTHMKKRMYVETPEEAREEVEEEFEQLTKELGTMNESNFFFAEIWTGRGRRRLGRFYWRPETVYFKYDEPQPLLGRSEPRSAKGAAPPQKKIQSAHVTGIPKKINLDLAEEQKRKHENAAAVHRIENECARFAARLKFFTGPRKTKNEGGTT
jgi:hypothetical protein